MIKLFLDLETTGVDPRKNSIHQVAGMFEVDGEVVETFDIKTRPHPKCVYDPIALKTCNVTEEQLKAYTSMETQFKVFKGLLTKYVDRYNIKDKIFLVGFNNRQFDDVFLRKWFDHNMDAYFGSWFWSDSLDVMVLASQYLQDRRHKMPNFKLKSVAGELCIKVEEERLHDALYDVELTREIYRIVTGLEEEL